MRPASQNTGFQRGLGIALMIAGAVLVLVMLPLWFWLAVLGTACITAGWVMSRNWR